jgi:outer membrane protein assembly factor BamE (lipoprotein component of BamABCDE complex)
MRFIYLVLLTSFVACAAGCGAGYHARSTQAAHDGDRLSVGTVQREIRRGMSGGEVAEVLGSPNIVSTDEEGREVWIYDKISSEVTYSATSGTLILFSGSTGASSRSQRTLTIIIKYDADGRVRDVAYHSSRF